MNITLPPDIDRIWQRYADTWKQVIMHPRTFFNEWDHNEAREQVIVFNIICGVLAGIIKTILTFGSAFSAIIVYPILMLIGTLTGGAILFLFFKLSGGEGDIEPTIKLVGYTQAVSVISYGLPTVGPLLFFYQMILLTAVGTVYHKLDIRTSLFAVVIPIVLYMVLIALIATILGVSFFGGILSHEGQVL